MRKLILLAMAVFTALYAVAQEKMIILMNDDSTVEYNVSDVKKVIFETPDSKLYEEPCTVWGATVAQVKSYMKDYTLNNQQNQNSVTVLSFAGKYQELFTGYGFENGKLYTAEIAISTSNTTEDELDSKIKENYIFLAESDGIKMSYDALTTVLFKENTTYSYFQIDYYDTALFIDNELFEEPYVNWGATRSVVKAEMENRGYKIGAESTEASNNYSIIYVGKKREYASGYYFDSTQSLMGVQVYFDASEVSQSELTEYLTSELKYIDTDDGYYLTSDNKTAVMLKKATTSDKELFVLVYQSSGLNLARSEAINKESFLEFEPMLDKKIIEKISKEKSAKIIEKSKLYNIGFITH